MKKFLILMMTLMFFVQSAEAAKFVIFHTNDMHARITATDDGGKSIGFAEMAAVVKAEPGKTLWFDAGDTFHGLPDVNINRGETMVKLLNLSPVAAMAPGNHDFNYGWERMKKISRELKATVLSANIVKRDTDKNIFKPYKIFKVDGIKVGVFGLTTPDTARLVNPMCVKQIEFTNPVEAARLMVQKLKPQCDVIIALTHLGVDDADEFTSKRVAKEVDGIDIIIDGHSHTELPEGIVINGTLIAQTGCYEHNLGKVEVELDGKKIISKSAKLLSKDDVKNLALAPDAKIAQTLADIKAENANYLNKVLTKSDRNLDWGKYTVRHDEMEIGNLVADAFRWKLKADIAVTNGGGIRAGLPSGNVTRGDVLKILPFDNQVVALEATGKIIHEMLEHAVDKYPYPAAKFLQVSGITFDFDPTQPAGQRISNIFVGDAALDESKTYSLAVTDFMAVGGDGYDMLKDLKIIKSAKLNLYSDCLVEYLEKCGVGNVEVGRIHKLNEVIPVLPADTAQSVIRELEEAHVEYKLAA